jgi:hypothetical protein
MALRYRREAYEIGALSPSYEGLTGAYPQGFPEHRGRIVPLRFMAQRSYRAELPPPTCTVVCLPER